MRVKEIAELCGISYRWVTAGRTKCQGIEKFNHVEQRHKMGCQQ